MNNLGPEGGKAIASGIRDNSSMTSASLLGNKFDDEAVSLLLKVKEEKPQLFSLCGLKPDQTEADLSGKKLGPEGAILVAWDLRAGFVSSSMTKSRSTNVNFRSTS